MGCHDVRPVHVHERCAALEESKKEMHGDKVIVRAVSTHAELRRGDGEKALRTKNGMHGHGDPMQCTHACMHVVVAV